MAPQYNLFLSSLATDDLNAILPHLTKVRLPQRTVLYENGDPIAKVYFPYNGIVSLVIELAPSDLIEIAMIGRDSLIGGSAIVNGTRSLNTAITQTECSASVLDAHRLRDLALQSPAVLEILLKHSQLLFNHMQQSVACNAMHSVEERVCRWLLRARDLIEGDELPLTHEIISQMIGSTRTTVSLVAHTLQQAGLIRYKRGNIRVLDPEGLRESACQCYETVKSQSLLIMT